jgi:hypothetical protein
MGSGAKSYMITAFSYMVKYLHMGSSYIRKPFVIYDFAPDLNFLIYEENFLFFFNSVFSVSLLLVHLLLITPFFRFRVSLFAFLLDED